MRGAGAGGPLSQPPSITSTAVLWGYGLAGSFLCSASSCRVCEVLVSLLICPLCWYTK